MHACLTSMYSLTFIPESWHEPNKTGIYTVHNNANLKCKVHAMHTCCNYSKYKFSHIIYEQERKYYIYIYIYIY